MIPGRKDDQCAKRYTEILDPSAETRLRDWTEEEDRILRQSVETLGHRWASISAHLHKRPPLTCRNRWRHLSDKLKSSASGSPSVHEKQTTPRISDLTQMQSTIDLPSPNSTALGQLESIDYQGTTHQDDFLAFLGPVTNDFLLGDTNSSHMEGLDFSNMHLSPVAFPAEGDISTDYESTANAQSSPSYASSIRSAPRGALQEGIQHPYTDIRPNYMPDAIPPSHNGQDTAVPIPNGSSQNLTRHQISAGNDVSGTNHTETHVEVDHKSGQVHHYHHHHHHVHHYYHYHHYHHHDPAMSHMSNGATTENVVHNFSTIR